MPDATREESESRDSPSPTAPELESPESDRDLKQMNETLQTLRQALELKERGGLGEAEYQELKKRLLAQSGLRLPPVVARRTTIAVPEITEQAVRQASIGLYAGELHQLLCSRLRKISGKRKARQRMHEIARGEISRITSSIPARQAISP